MQIKKYPQKGKGAYLRGEFQKCIKITMSLGLRTTTLRSYRTDGSQFSYTSKT